MRARRHLLVEGSHLFVELPRGASVMGMWADIAAARRVPLAMDGPVEPAWFTTDADPGAPPAVIQIVADDECAVIELRDGKVNTRLGRATDPDLVLDGPPRAVLGLLSGVIDLKHAGQLGLSTRGRRDLLGRLRPVAQEEAHDHTEARR